MKQIEFKTSTKTSSASGFVSSTPVSYWITRAEVTPISSNKERGQEAHQTIMQSGYVFKIRYRSDKEVTKSMSLVYDGKELTIQSIENIKEEGRYLKVVGIVNE